ncbi:MAG: GIY-YIG nuclease family protein [Candidatus Ranarchaeia archaeon]
MTQGSYILLLDLKKSVSLEVGSLGKLFFSPSLYLYFGSALGPSKKSLELRIRRHYQKQKKVKWHIDHLTTINKIKTLFSAIFQTSVTLECDLLKYFRDKNGYSVTHQNFGSTDCTKSCSTHLLSTKKSIAEIKQDIMRASKELKSSFQIIKQ